MFGWFFKRKKKVVVDVQPTEPTTEEEIAYAEMQRQMAATNVHQSLRSATSNTKVTAFAVANSRPEVVRSRRIEEDTGSDLLTTIAVLAALEAESAPPTHDHDHGFSGGGGDFGGGGSSGSWDSGSSSSSSDSVGGCDGGGGGGCD